MTGLADRLERRRRPPRPVLWGGRVRDIQVGGQYDRVRSRILGGTVAYRRAVVSLIAEVSPALREAARTLSTFALEHPAATPIRSRPSRLRRFGL